MDANGPAGVLTRGASALPQLEHQGFEPSPFDQDDSRADVDELLSPVRSPILRYASLSPV